MELPVVRHPSEDEREGGRVCQECRYWLRNPRTYAWGVCVLGGTKMPPRWSLELQTCDGWEKGNEP
jgi:hypothetical protein